MAEDDGSAEQLQQHSNDSDNRANLGHYGYCCQVDKDFTNHQTKATKKWNA
jgi:hypothetical protein